MAVIDTFSPHGKPGDTLSLILVPVDVRSLPEDIHHHEWPDVQADSAVEIWVPAN
jgi:hypothetical protein